MELQHLIKNWTKEMVELKDEIQEYEHKTGKSAISAEARLQAISEIMADVKQLKLPSDMCSFSIEDLRKAFEDAKKGGIKKVPVMTDQYGSINIEEHYVTNFYKTFEDWYEKNYA